MRSIVRIAGFEIRQFLRRGSFWAGFFGIPLISLILGVTLFGVSLPQGGAPPARFGVVDEATILQGADLGIYAGRAVRYEGRNEASAALAKREIELFYVVPRDYRATGTVLCFLSDRGPLRPVPAAASSILAGLLRLGISRGNVAPGEMKLFANPVHARIFRVSRKGTVDSGDESERGRKLALPILMIVMFVSTVLFSSTYLLNSVSVEKQNRVFELLIVRVPLPQLIAGKLAGIAVVCVSQQIFYAAGLIWTAASLGAAPMPWATLAPALLGLVLGYLFISLGVLVAGMLANVGRDNTQLTLILVMTVALPVVMVFAPDWNSGLPRAMSIFPLTSPMAMLLRICFSDVPASDLLCSFAASIGAFAITFAGGVKLLRVSLAGGLRFAIPQGLRSPSRQAG